MAEAALTRRERKKEETKERILTAAFELFRQKGVEATTVEEISEKADVAKGTFFNYFPRKEAVFGYLSETWVADAEERAAEILAGRAPLWTRARDMFVEFAQFYEAERELSRYMALEWTRQMHAGDEVCRRWDALGVHVVQTLQGLGEIRRDVDAERIHGVLADVYHATIMRWFDTPEPPFSLKSELRKRLTLVLEGLAPRS